MYCHVSTWPEPVSCETLLWFSCEPKRDLPAGVYRAGNRYRTEITVESRTRYLGRYETPAEAERVYKSAREAKEKGKFEEFWMRHSRKRVCVCVDRQIPLLMNCLLRWFLPYESASKKTSQIGSLRAYVASPCAFMHVRRSPSSMLESIMKYGRKKSFKIFWSQKIFFRAISNLKIVILQRNSTVDLQQNSFVNGDFQNWNRSMEIFLRPENFETFFSTIFHDRLEHTRRRAP